MNVLLFFLGVGVFGFLLVWAIRTPSRWKQLVMEAAQNDQIQPMLDELDRRPKELQPRFYDEAMQLLMRDNRNVAVRLAIAFTPRHPGHKRVQYWLSKIQELNHEPPLLSTEFLEKYHRACCSPAGG